MGNRVIVTCAVTGSIHVPSQSDYLPVTPSEIAESAIGAAAAGAAILHLHARNPEDGMPTPDPDIFKQFVPQIMEECDAVINISTGGAATMSLDERIAAARELRPEVVSLNLGSMNFGLFPMSAKIREFKHPWEEAYLEGSADRVFKNTFADIEVIVRTMSEYGTRFEFECYDIGHLYTLAHFLDRGIVKPPLFIQTVLGILGGVGPRPEHLVHFRATADRLFGDAYEWSTLGAGRHQMGLVTMSAIMGGHVRVGLEDSLWLGKGSLARSNADQVRRIVNILKELSLEVASPDEARQMLALRGASAADSAYSARKRKPVA